jgi:hypothetical protein
VVSGPDDGTRKAKYEANAPIYVPVKSTFNKSAYGKFFIASMLQTQFNNAMKIFAVGGLTVLPK